MNIYIYNNINSVDMATWQIIDDNDTLVSGIHYCVLQCDLQNKGLQYCIWNEETKQLNVVFENALTVEEKECLDLAVSNNTT